MISRLAFDLAIWSKGGLPMLLVCEEAHRYAPAGDTDKFFPTRRALSRIAKEGRKYGVSLALVTQRPSDLDPTILSQCSTMVALRLSSERDQHVVRANTHEGALDLLEFLPLLGDREAIVLGQGVSMPMRITFADLGKTDVPRNLNTSFSKSWKQPNMDRAALNAIVTRWRASGREGAQDSLGRSSPGSRGTPRGRPTARRDARFQIRDSPDRAAIRAERSPPRRPRWPGAWSMPARGTGRAPPEGRAPDRRRACRPACVRGFTSRRCTAPVSSRMKSMPWMPESPKMRAIVRVARSISGQSMRRMTLGGPMVPSATSTS